MSRWSRESVTARFSEARDTLRRVPAPRVRGFFVSWPPYIRDMAESANASHMGVRLSPASPQAIDRMHEVFGWFIHLNGKPHLTKALWLTAAVGMGPKRAGAILGAHRDTIRARRDEALDILVHALNTQRAAA